MRSRHPGLALPERLSLRMHLLIRDGRRNFGMQIQSLRRFLRGYVHGEDEAIAPCRERD